MDRSLDPRWSGPCLAAVAALAAVLMSWGLARNGYANSYYSSAVYAASKSWSSFFLGALDLSGYVTVDKPPLSIWMMALSARAFGFGALSLLIPNALCGVASVLVLHDLVRRSLGPRVAIVAALALALTPVMVAVGRFNNPDALLVLLLVCSAWAATRAMESGRTRHLVACGVLLGLAFNTKMLQAYLVLPGIAVAFVATGAGSLRRRLVQLAVCAGAMLAVSLAWVSAMMLLPASERPWVGDTTANSWWQLIVGGNGLARIGTASAVHPAGGEQDVLRLFDQQTGGQIAWLIPLAAVGLAAGLWTTRRVRRRSPRRGAFLLWGGWAAVHVVIFSLALNIFHPYYTSALAPAIAVLAASGLVTLWDHRSGSVAVKAGSALAVLATAGLAILLLGRREGFVPWLPWVVGGLAMASVAGGLALGRPSWHRRRLGAFVVAAGLAATLSGSAAYAITTVSEPLAGTDPVAGPPAPAGGPHAMAAAHAPRVSGSHALIEYLSTHRGKARYLVAANGSLVAAPIILGTRQPVVTMGGFAGTDPAPTPAQLRRLIESGQLRFVLLSDRTPPAMAGLKGLGLRGGQARSRWVRSRCRALALAPLVGSPVGPWHERIYDCSAAATP